MMRTYVLILALALPAAHAFAPSSFAKLASSSPRATLRSGTRSVVCVDAVASRRSVLAGLLSIPFAATLPAGANTYDPKDPASREAYIEEQSGGKKARWGKQPTRLDVERNVKKIILVKETMDKAQAAAEKGDTQGIAAAIGDLSIEATKKNVNLGKEIPIINIAKSYMYAYAATFSKAADSPLTTDLKNAADAYYVAMGAASAAAKAGDLAGSKASLKSASDALNAYANAIEAETLDGRLNSIISDHAHCKQKVSVKAMVDSNATGVVDSFMENKRVQRDQKDKKFL